MATKPNYYQIAYNSLNLAGKKPLPDRVVRTATKTTAQPVTTETQPAKNKSTYTSYATELDRQNNILLQQYELAEKQRKAAMNATISANNQAADASLNQAYIANMQAKKNLPQQLKAAGISGGASESTLAGIENTYMNNRASIEAARNQANGLARQNYSTGVTDDYMDYLSALAKLKNTTTKTTKAKGTAATQPQTTSDSYNSMTVSLGKNTYTLPQLITSLSAIGMSDENIERFLNSNGIR